jgi:hypothetical protein
MIADHGGGERFVDRRIAALTAGLCPLAGIHAFAAREQRLEADAIRVAGGQFRLGLGRRRRRRMRFGGARRTAQPLGRFRGQTVRQRVLQHGFDQRRRSAVLGQDFEIAFQPGLVGRLLLQQPIEQAQGAARVPAFAIQLCQMETGHRIVAVVAQRQLEFAEGQRHQARLFAQQRPVAVPARLAAACHHSGFELGSQGSVFAGRQTLAKGVHLVVAGHRSFPRCVVPKLLNVVRLDKTRTPAVRPK